MKKLALIVLFFAVGASTAWASAIEGGGVEPWANPIFVRGGFNGWGLTDQMTWNGNDYSATISIDAGDWEFKIADEGWSNPDFGPTGDTAVTLGLATDIGTAIGANFMLSLAAPTTLLFVLSGIATDLQSGTLLVTAVTPIPLPGALLLFASGLFGLRFFRRR